MGWTSEMVAQAYKVSRETQDSVALLSHLKASKVSCLSSVSIPIQIEKFRRCTQAVAEGRFAEEIIPINLRGVVVSEDDTIRHGVTIEGLAALKPAFPNWGESITTAGNASGLGDGAALCILTTRSEAFRRGLEVIGKYVTSAVVGQSVTALSLVFLFTSVLGVEPRYMGISPIYAIPKALGQAGLTKNDVDVYEVRKCSIFLPVH